MPGVVLLTIMFCLRAHPWIATAEALRLLIWRADLFTMGGARFGVVQKASMIYDEAGSERQGAVALRRAPAPPCLTIRAARIGPVSL